MRGLTTADGSQGVPNFAPRARPMVVMSFVAPSVADDVAHLRLNDMNGDREGGAIAAALAAMDRRLIFCSDCQDAFARPTQLVDRNARFVHGPVDHTRNVFGPGGAEGECHTPLHDSAQPPALLLTWMTACGLCCAEGGGLDGEDEAAGSEAMEPFGSPLELLTFPLEGSSEEEYSQWNQNHSFLFGALVIPHSRQPQHIPSDCDSTSGCVQGWRTACRPTRHVSAIHPPTAASTLGLIMSFVLRCRWQLVYLRHSAEPYHPGHIRPTQAVMFDACCA